MRSSIIRSGDDVIYYNIEITGNPTSNVPTPATFYEERTQSILDNPSDYYMSVVRFSIDGWFIPLFVCPVVENPLDSTDLNYTPFVVTLSANGDNYSEHVRYVPESLVNPLPKPPVGNVQDLSTSYYYVYTYTRFINMVNQAISVAFGRLIFDHPVFNITQHPYFEYNDITRIISLVIRNDEILGTNIWITPTVPQANILDPNTPPIDLTAGQPIQPQPSQTIYFYLNEKLFSFFDGFETFGYHNTSFLNKEELFVFRDNRNNHYYPSKDNTNTTINQTELSFSGVDGLGNNAVYTAQPKYFIFRQQYSIISTWNSLSSIVFTTSHLPIQVEYIPSTSIFNTQGSSNAHFRPIVTDFIPDLETPGSTRSRFLYTPSGQYRLIDLHSQIPLRKIDIQMYWQDQYQNLYPLFISYNESNSVKLMFIKKSMANFNFKL